MIVTQLVLAFCVGFSLAQEASDKKQALELDGKDGAGLTNAEYDQNVSFLNKTVDSYYHCILTGAARGSSSYPQLQAHRPLSQILHVSSLKLL